MTYPRKPQQDTAERVVWWDTYAASNDLPPDVQWVPGEPCGSHSHAIACSLGCCAGLTWADRRFSEVVWTGFYSTSAYAHELLHQRLYDAGIPNGDPGHTRSEWSELLPLANQRLEGDGL